MLGEALIIRYVEYPELPWDDTTRESRQLLVKKQHKYFAFQGMEKKRKQNTQSQQPLNHHLIKHFTAFSIKTSNENKVLLSSYTFLHTALHSSCTEDD